jgi:ankyrin repeat protein
MQMLDDVDLDLATALHVAAEKGSLKVCEILLRHGTNPSAAKKSGATPLHSAAKAGNIKLCHLFLQVYTYYL